MNSSGIPDVCVYTYFSLEGNFPYYETYCFIIPTSLSDFFFLIIIFWETLLYLFRIILPIRKEVGSFTEEKVHSQTTTFLVKQP